MQELDSQLESIIEEFPTFNKELFEAVFPNCREQLKTVCVMVVVGTRENHIVKPEEGLYTLTDLIHIADYTCIVSQIIYILQDYLTFELSEYLIQKRFSVRSRRYLSLLDCLALTDGPADYLAWNASYSSYKFYTRKCEAHKEHAFSLLSQALQVKTKALQHKALVGTVTQEFQGQFPSVASMFYFDDIYRDLDREGIVLLYRHGPKSFVQMVLHE